MGDRTDRRAELTCAVLLLCLVPVGCSRGDSAQQTYRQAWAAFVHGNLRQANELTSAGMARLERQHNSPAYWDLRLLRAEVLTAQADRQGAAALLADPVPSQRGLEQDEVRRLIDLAANGQQTRDQTAALLAKAAAGARDTELLFRVHLTRGNTAYNQGRAAEARTAYQAALDVAVRQGDLYDQAQALNGLCLTAKALHQYEESVAFGTRALAMSTRLGAWRIGALVHGNLGSTYTLLSDFDSALQHEQSAIQAFEAIGARSNLMIALGELGLLYDRQNDFAKARENYERAFAMAHEQGNDREAARLAANNALTLLKLEQWPAAEEWNNRAADLAHKSGNAYAASLVARNRARIAYGLGKAEEAAAMCRQLLAENPDEPSIRWESYYLLGVIDSAARRFPQADRNYEAALRIISQNRSELLEPRNRITLLSRLIQFYRAYVDTLVVQNDDARALRVVESSRARVLSEQLGRDLQPQDFPDLASFERAAASTHTAILSFWLQPARSFAWLITAKRVQRFQLPGEAEIEKLVGQYRETVEHSLYDPLHSGGAAGLALWQVLLAQAAPSIPKDAPLIVIPDGVLYRLNLGTLIAPTPKPHYWIEDAQIAVSPSITIAASRPAPGAASPNRALLVIGSPNYTGTSWEPLANAGSEIRSIESHFGGWTQKVYEGAQASPAAYRESDPVRYSLIHFAAHAEADFQRPLQSAIILSPRDNHFKLLAGDVADIPIQASLVTISACRSAGTRAYAGEGLLGFAWAFLHAGARAVIAGLWDVSDSSTGQLMDRLYEGIASGEDPPAALRAAQLSLLHSGAFQKPFYWAPFQVYLGSAAR